MASSFFTNNALFDFHFKALCLCAKSINCDSLMENIIATLPLSV